MISPPKQRELLVYNIGIIEIKRSTKNKYTLEIVWKEKEEESNLVTRLKKGVKDDYMQGAKQ